MTSLPSVIPPEIRPADMQALWDTAVNASKDDEAPWLILADFCDEHGWHGLAAACRHPRGNWYACQADWANSGMAIVIDKVRGGWERLEPVLRADA